MYTRILVPLDGSRLAEQVLPYVRVLATGLKAHVTLLSAFAPVSLELAAPSRGVFLDRIVEGYRFQTQEYLDGVQASLKDLGVALSTVVCEDDAAPLIVREAEKEKGTLIAMSTHGRGGIGRWLTGSTADKVLHATSNPLLVVRPRDPKAPAAEVRLTTVIVPLDGSPVAEQIIPAVVALARPLGLKALLVQAVPGPESYWGYGEYMPVLSAPPTPEIEAQAQGYLEEVRRRLRAQGVGSGELKVVQGHAASAIIDLARRVPDNLVAITTHGRSGVGRWILGSVADRVVRYSFDPVLLVRAVEKPSA